jgi:hypothetical protein
MLTPGILDSFICVSSHDVNDGEGQLPAAAGNLTGNIIRMSITTIARANGFGMHKRDVDDLACKAAPHGLGPREVMKMPANNLSLVFVKPSPAVPA